MLPKPERLSKDKDIRDALKENKYRTKTTLLYLTAKDNTLPYSRLVVITPRRLGKAVQRNRLRRRLVTAYSENRHKLGKYVDLVIMPNHKAIDNSYLAIKIDLNTALQAISDA